MLLYCISASTHTIAGGWRPCRHISLHLEGVVEVSKENQYKVSNNTNSYVTKMHELEKNALKV